MCSQQNAWPVANTPPAIRMSVPFDKVQELPETIQSMIGYSIHPPFIGHVDGRHPLKAAERLAKL